VRAALLNCRLAKKSSSAASDAHAHAVRLLLLLLPLCLQVNARVLGDGTAFRLVATQHIEQGQQVGTPIRLAEKYGSTSRA
jgi:hypothetical protein